LVPKLPPSLHCTAEQQQQQQQQHERLASLSQKPRQPQAQPRVLAAAALCRTVSATCTVASTKTSAVCWVFSSAIC